MATVIQTERLILREMEPSDVDELAAMYADPEVMRYIGTGGVRGRDAAEESIAKQLAAYSERGWGEWAAVRRDTGEMIGECGLILWPDIDGVAEVEVAYLLARSAWGKGFGTEAAIAIRDWGFSELGRDRLISLVYHDNVASIGVARKAGASWEKDVAFGDTHVALYVYGPG